MDKEFYFDYAAATPLDERVLSAMVPYFTEKFYNPSSPYAPAVQVRREYEEAKHSIAQAIGANGDEIVITAGATESINLAISSFSGHKICTETEHESVRQAIAVHKHTFIPVDEFGRVNLDKLKEAIKPQTELISIALANHEIGTVQPIADVAAIVQQVRQQRLIEGDQTPLLLHCDASQGYGVMDVHVSRLGVDLLTLNSAKIYGPKQVGLLWIKPGVQIKPVVRGGGQEMGLRSGTENVAGTIGFAEAVRLADKKRKGEVARLRPIRDAMERQLVQAFPQAVLSGHRKYRLANFLHISFPGLDAERLLFMLEMKNICVATGSACAANKGTGSVVLAAIGLDESIANGSLRITLGRYSSQEGAMRAADEIIAVVKQEYKRMEQMV